jgi:hypothetical protein
MFPISRRSTWLAEKADAIKEALCTGVLAHDRRFDPAFLQPALSRHAVDFAVEIHTLAPNEEV